jgi:hypothetical protein
MVRAARQQGTTAAGSVAACQLAIDVICGLIREEAALLPETGGLEETRKWGQLAFLPRNKSVGTTLRVAVASETPPRVGLYVHCQTSLIATCRDLFGDRLTYEGTRAVVFDAGKPLPVDELRHISRMALTYHIAKKRLSAKSQ